MPGLRSLAIVLAALMSLAAAATVAAGDDDERPDVRVATFSGGRCGKLTDSLPALITRTGVRPGEVVGDLTVCVANRGGAGRLVLAVTELVDLDPACSGAEAVQDATCGAGGPGELSPSLLQHIGVGACPSTPATTPRLGRSLPALRARPLTIVDELRRGQVVCVRLRLGYEPDDDAAASISQSDRTTWRYEFVLSAGGD